jgi:hypothetical protein
MSIANALFLLLRVSHVLLAALWIGMAAFVALFLMPAVEDAGPASGAVMAALVRRKFPVFMAAIGGTVVLTGLYLYWRFTGGFDPALSATRAAMVFGTGGLSGIAALIVGGVVVSRNAKKMADAAGRLPSVAEGPARAVLVGDMNAARRKVTVGGRIVVVLQAIALAAMAIGHYV